ncbi:glycosyltransferase family 2 protein [Gelidibacter japonicus]|uniref:glycosyltransferase family 2 protein n=1 Tax=Gelidibacter japonicus TaxID=1962232 RepID=UPI003A93F28F
MGKVVKSKYSGKSIAIVLPAYNEELTIAETIKSFYEQIPEANFYVVNNCSTDRTEEISLETFAELGCDGIVINENRKGKGNALRRAFLEIEADVYVLSDADMTYPADRVDDLIAPVLNSTADIVVGDRHSGGHYGQENKRMLHNFGNNLVRNLVNYFFNSSLKDIMSGYRAISKRFVKNYPILVEAFEIETDMTLHALDKRFRIVEVSVEYKDRPEGSVSKLNTISDGAKVLFTILRILRYYKPLFFFGTCALLLASTGFLVGLPVIFEWLEFRYIKHLPLAVLATGIEIIAFIFMSIGLLLDSVVHLDKNAFERALLKNDEKKYLGK